MAAFIYLKKIIKRISSGTRTHIKNLKNFCSNQLNDATLNITIKHNLSSERESNSQKPSPWQGDMHLQLHHHCNYIQIEQMTRIELASLVWKTKALAIVLHLHNIYYVPLKGFEPLPVKDLILNQARLPVSP